MEARTAASPVGAIRFDASLIPAPDAGWFDVERWRERGAVVNVAGAGRGSAWSIRSRRGHFVLRHYRRGGMLRSLLVDRYLFQSAQRTRGFMEFDLLARLHGEGYAVPEPVAVAYVRSGLWYRADLLMRAIESSRSLHDALSAEEGVEWEALGAVIAGLHRRGVWHADLNAHNALIDGQQRFFIIDFDRACIRGRAGAWQRANLARLARSLRKLGHAGALAQGWPRLERGYAAGLT